MRLHPDSLTRSTVVLDPRTASGPLISELLYSGFVEHLGRCIYGGLVDDPKHPSPKGLLIPQEGPRERQGRLGWRKDVLDELKELETPMLRWPGGNFVSNYHWQDGIGPIADRPRRIELAWRSDESNKFGTDEFIDYCRAVGCEPYLCLNMGTGTFEEALAWVEYCNGTGDTHWANLRRKHTGRDEPHNVKYWGLGNEMWGPWQVGNMKAGEYAELARRWAHGIKLVDPSITVVSCGREGNCAWDQTVLEALTPYVDMHSIHFYSTLGQEKVPAVKGLEYENNVFGPAAAEHSIELCAQLLNKINIERIARGEAKRDVRIAYDEWNVWDEVKADATNGLEQAYDYTDMLGFVGWLHVLVRQHGHLGLACMAQSVNVISPIMTSPDGLLKQTTYYPWRAFSRGMKNGRLLQLPTLPDVYTGTTYPAWIQHIGAPSYVDIVAITTSSKPTIKLSILNRHPSAEWVIDLQFNHFAWTEAHVEEMYSDDLAAKNTFDDPHRVVPTKKHFSAKEWQSEEQVVRAHSWKLITFT